LIRIIIFLLILAIACAAFTGCANQAAPEKQPETTSAAAESPTVQSPVSATTAPANADLTLAAIKKAAEAAGYIISDGHQFILMDGIVGGITIEIVADGAHTLYSVAECETEEVAVRNAKNIDDAGYAVALRNGKFISSYDAERKGEERKEILTSILAGNPLPAPPYPAATQTPQQNLEVIPAYDRDAIPDDGMQEGQGFVEYGDLFIKIIGMEKKLLGDQPGIVLNYELTNLSDESVDTQGALYVEVLQNGRELKHPDAFESVYLTITELAPNETLAFYDEYLLDNEMDPVEAKIRQFLVMVSDPLCVYKTFPLD